MKKIKMWYVKLAFAALFFTAIAGLPTQGLQAATQKQYQYTLSIPAIKVNAGVLGMGITSTGRMAVPNNYTEVGWYNLGAKPGEVGSTVMGAHVDNGGKINGVFKNLKYLKVGNTILVTDSKGT